MLAQIELSPPLLIFEEGCPEGVGWLLCALTTTPSAARPPSAAQGCASVAECRMHESALENEEGRKFKLLALDGVAKLVRPEEVAAKRK